MVRAGEMFRELKDLQIPPRYSGSLNYGYGYPLFNFVYPTPYYFSTALHLTGLGFIISVKMIFVLSVIASFMGMFMLSKKFWDSNVAGFFSAVLYTYLPYRLVDLFVRGSLGESISFAIYPFIIYFSLFILNEQKKNFFIILNSLLFATLITAHNISSVYFGVIYIAFVFGVFLTGERKSSLLLIVPLIWGLLISFYFWGVALFEKENILLSTIPIADRNLYFVDFGKLIYSPWGYGTPTDSSPFTYSLGIPQFIAFAVSLFVSFKLKNSLEKNISLAFAILFLIFIFMIFPSSTLIWELPILSEINYPWTLLLPLGFLMSFLSGFIIKNVKFGIYIGVMLAIFSVILYVPYAKPSAYVDRDDSFYLTNEATTTSSNELMPLWVKEKPTKRFENKVDGAQYNLLTYSSNKIFFSTNSQNEQEVFINQIYYPGWKAFVNGKEKEISYDNKPGIMEINLPEGSNSVLLKFEETPFRLLADIISLASLVGLILFFFYSIIKE